MDKLYKKTIQLKNNWLEKYPDDALHLLVIGGTHGNESNAVKMVSDFTNKLISRANYGSGCWWENTNISKVTVVNALNTIGLKYNEREFNGEEKRETNDLNRYFDSKEPVTKEEIMDELENIIKDVDVVVDVHNSPNILSCVSIALNKNAPAYIDWAIKNNVHFVLADDTPTIKRHADMDLGKIAFTYEFSGMGYDQRRDPNWPEWEVNGFEKFLECIAKTWDFDKFFEREWEYDKGNSRVFKHTFWKRTENPYITYLPYLYEKKYFQIPTYGNGVYNWIRGNPLGHYKKDEQIAFIMNPIDGGMEGEIRAPCDGTLIDVDDSWWACFDGAVGDFQPDLNPDAYDYWNSEEVSKREKAKKEASLPREEVNPRGH